ncbi:type I-E CRISPR-associated protein Cse1/CasA [Bosea sp. RAC05]|uniref:type I-E CRISPR-associated protein Cse1/CasA n=1 Tax=Bosea sp. RAC05 TaxID=1842539 RepID=UPI0008564FD7|nr:type I-E CRISPR-associated protein Cse1/CasA [Bosea sp. RAC05]AOG03031.1 CRISPR type I-E-associated protein CasA/Cse1 [Bosea sp. RAC05]
MPHSLLTDPIFRVSLTGGDCELTLPGLLTALVKDDVVDLPSVRPHQRQASHSFLCQLGAIAGQKAEGDLPVSEDVWRHLLLALTGDGGETAWEMVVADLTKPAFMQPAIPENSIAALKETETTPDVLDMLVTSKNHDIKASRLSICRMEHWAWSLITLQTLEGFLGAGNYGVARMNGGFASRPLVGVVPDGGIGARFKRDVERMIDIAGDVSAEFGFKPESSSALLWTIPWDGKSQLQLVDLHPYFIEVCRRVRLVETPRGIIARRGSSSAARVRTDKLLGGISGDPWAPIDQRKAPAKVLTVDASGFDYKRVTMLLDASMYRPSPMQRWVASDGQSGLSLHFCATVRGQGGTDGFHERRIPVPPGIALRLARRTDAFAVAARQGVEDAAAVRRKALYPALLCLFQNAPESLDFRHSATEARSQPFLDGFDSAVDAVFFEWTFEHIGADGDAETVRDIRTRWIKELSAFAKAQLAAALATTPRLGVRKYFSSGAAQSVLEASLRKHFEELKDAA